MKKTLLLIFAASCIVMKSQAQFETVKDSVVQLFGIVMTADDQGIAQRNHHQPAGCIFNCCFKG
jgi:hypothetical protein